MYTDNLIGAFFFVSTSLALPQYGTPGTPGNPHRIPKNDGTTSDQRAQAVRDAFIFAWNGYNQYAFPNDELHSVSNSYGNSRNGWGASAVDALSTACVMRIPEIVNQIVNYIPTIDYSQSRPADEQVSLFETTIRYLGGMLAGYDLLKGPLAGLATIVGLTSLSSLSQTTDCYRRAATLMPSWFSLSTLPVICNMLLKPQPASHTTHFTLITAPPAQAPPMALPPSAPSYLNGLTFLI